jgi:hypothetical protein
MRRGMSNVGDRAARQDIGLVSFDPQDVACGNTSFNA